MSDGWDSIIHNANLQFVPMAITNNGGSIRFRACLFQWCPQGLLPFGSCLLLWSSMSKALPSDRGAQCGLINDHGHGLSLVQFRHGHAGVCICEHAHHALISGFRTALLIQVHLVFLVTRLDGCTKEVDMPRRVCHFPPSLLLQF